MTKPFVRVNANNRTWLSRL